MKIKYVKLPLYNNESVSLDTQYKQELFSNPLYKAIIESKIFKRLKNIRFLGAIDYMYSNRKRHNRYDHSLGVAKLAYRYSNIKNLSQENESYLVCAALLHDIGHAPLSHSMEPSFKKKFNIDHHIATLKVIKGTSPLGQEIEYILNKYNVDIEKLIKLLDGKSKEDYAFALYNPINIDTIDAIIRSYSYLFTSSNKNEKLSVIPKTYEILDALIYQNKEEVLYNFWEIKNLVYNSLIHENYNLYADYLSQQFVLKEHNIQESDFYLCDNKFKTKFKILFELLKEIKKHDSHCPSRDKMTYMKRTYTINKHIKINNSNDYNKKFTSYKTKSYLNIKLKNQLLQKSLKLG